MNPVHVGRPELLSPAGDWECLRAAVANGADAIYFGLSRFNARGRATNFSPEDLPAVIKHLHDRNAKGYVALNTLVFSEELPQAAKYIEAIARAGADAVIVQDVGVLRLIRRMAPTLPVHASTQMTQTHAAGLKRLEDWGVRRVILARELGLDQIRMLRRQCSMELEVFVHGALCISFSGQCLASQCLFSRSANRGLCAQACRLPYELLVDGRPAGAPGAKYLLSPQDLCAIDRIGELVAAGVAGLKIEGRMKSAHYVAAATGAYRAAIDEAVEGRKPARTDLDELRMAQCFSRGFTEGFMGGANHRQLVEGSFPKSRGVLVGVVAGVSGRGVVLRLHGPESALRPGDGVVFDEGQPQRDEQGGRVYSVRPASGEGILPSWKCAAGLTSRRVPVDREVHRAGRAQGRDALATRGQDARDTQGRDALATHGQDARDTQGRDALATCVEITFGEGDVNLAAVAVGAKVWKTDDPRLRREIEKTYSRDVPWRREALRVRVEAEPGGALRVTATDAAGRQGRAQWPGPLQPSDRHPLTMELLREQFARLGNTPFELEAVELLGPGGAVESIPVMAPKSVLNNLRREAVAALQQLRDHACRHEVARPKALDEIRAEIAGQSPAAASDGAPCLCVLARSIEQVEAVLAPAGEDSASFVAMLYCDMSDAEESARAVSLAKAAGVPVAVATPVVLMPGEEDVLRRLIDAGPDAVLVRNLAALEILKSIAPGLRRIGDYHLHVANEIAAATLIEAGLERVTAGFDLDASGLAAMLARVAPAAVEVIAHLHAPMFHTAHCLWAANLPGGANCADCKPLDSARDERLDSARDERPCRQHRIRLRDRNGEEHAVTLDPCGRNTVFASRPRTAAGSLTELSRAGVRHFRVELLEESGEEARRLICLRQAQGLQWRP